MNAILSSGVRRKGTWSSTGEGELEAKLFYTPNCAEMSSSMSLGMIVAPKRHWRGPLLGELRMSLVWTSNPAVSRIEEEVTSLSAFYYCICTFLCHCHSSNLSLCHLPPFMLSCVAVSLGHGTCQNFTLMHQSISAPKYQSNCRED